MVDQEKDRLLILNQILERANTLADRLQKQADTFPELSAKILSRFSQALLERDLHQMVKEEQQRRKRQARLKGGGFKIGKDWKAK